MKTPSNDDQQTTPKKSKRPFIKLDYQIKEAQALSRTTIALYEALLWFQRNKDDCFPGYEKLKKRGKINSKTTLSLHLKVLIKVGLVKKTRRGKKQSNVYITVRADELTPQILKNLERPHKYILEDIAKADKEARKMREVKRELKELRNTKRIHPRRYKTASDQTYPHKSEVQLLDFHSKAFQASRYSSNRNKDSKFAKGEEAKRGGGIKKLSDLLPPIPKYAQIGILKPQNETIPPGGDKISGVQKTPQKTALQPLTELSKLEFVMMNVSRDIGDYQHVLENTKQAKNIYSQLKNRGVTEANFIDTLMSVEGLTKEIRGVLNKPGSYFFQVLRDRWKIENTSIKLDLLNTT